MNSEREVASQFTKTKRSSREIRRDFGEQDLPTQQIDVIRTT